MNTFVRFVIVGVIATGVHYVAYFVLCQLGFYYLYAFSLAYLLSFLGNYLLSSKFTFRKKKTVKNASYFSLAHGINYLLQSFLLFVFVSLGVSEALAPFCTWGISVPANFLMVRFAFREKGEEPEASEEEQA